MASVRFFVANLPNDVKESDIAAQFNEYGTVKHIDLKTPKGTAEADSKVIAFVTVQTDYAQDCVNDLNGQNINGYRIKVSLAKESFLERLKREREEQQAAAETKNEVQESENYDLPKSSLAYNESRNRKVFTEEDLIIGDDDELITKKRASTSLRHGKIVIEGSNSEPLHTIESAKEKPKKLDEKSLKADLKRKQSLKNLTDQYNQKKTAVQQALQHLDTPLAKKIKFTDDEQPKLFDSGDDDDDDDNVEIKFEEKSAKLTKLQSENEFADKRFKMDAKFLDEAEEEADQTEPVESERAWQIGILEQVVGKQLDSRKPADAKDKKQMLRYDPTNKNQQKYLRADKDATLELKQSKNTKVEQEAEKDENQSEMVNEMFYTVSDSLANAFKSENNEGFSLLNMFGQLQNETVKRNDQLKEVAKEKILVSNMDWNTANPFQYDSSDTENEVEVEETEVVKQESVKTGTKKANVILEHFFFGPQDARFEEGLALFKYDKPLTEDYNKVRDRLNLLIKTQINKKHKLSNGRTKKLNKRKIKV